MVTGSRIPTGTVSVQGVAVDRAPWVPSGSHLTGLPKDVTLSVQAWSYSPGYTFPVIRYADHVVTIDPKRQHRDLGRFTRRPAPSHFSPGGMTQMGQVSAEALREVEEAFDRSSTRGTGRHAIRLPSGPGPASCFGWASWIEWADHSRPGTGRRRPRRTLPPRLKKLRREMSR